MKGRAVREAPERLELVVEIAGVIGLLAELASDHLAVAHLRAGAVAVADNIERSMKVGEPVVDREEVVDVPLIGEGGPNVSFLGKGERG
jgi:hypothetical protein